MKKSIKYAGIAAATLLTVAPIAAPVVSQVTTVKADSADNADQSDLNTSITNFKNQFGDQEDTDIHLDATKDTAKTLALGSGNEELLSTFQSTNTTNANGIIKTPAAAGKLDKLEGQDAMVYTTITDNKGVTYDGSVGKDVSDLISAMKLDNHKPVSVTVYLKYKDLGTKAYTDYTKAASFSITKSDSDELKSVNANFTTPLTVAKKSKTAATQLVNSANISLKDQNGDSIATDSVVIPDAFYYTYSAAMEAAKGTIANNGNVSDSDISTTGADGSKSTDEFKTAGTYYQVITYNAKTGSALASLIKEFQNDPSSYTVYVNGKKASSGYDFYANAEADNKSSYAISFVRAINVSDSEAEWTTTDTTGVVTTKADHDYYTLKDDEGNNVTNRALAKNTAWKTNAVRTDQNGNKQYRVGGSEWIDANDVTFSDKATDNNGEGAYTNVKALNGVAKTAGPSGFVYPLFDDNGKQVTNRAVAGDTAWFTDKSAVNADGVTVYHVATGEWLQGNNVTYTAY